MKTRRARRRGVIGGLLVTSLFIVVPLWVCAAVPQRMTYQGYLTDSGGNPFHGTVTVTLAAGTNITLTPSGNTLTIWASMGGDITAVNVGEGLSGGGMSGDVTLMEARIPPSAERPSLLIPMAWNNTAWEAEGLASNLNGNWNTASGTGALYSIIVEGPITQLSVQSPSSRMFRENRTPRWVPT